jgi:hypothetical protein
LFFREKALVNGKERERFLHSRKQTFHNPALLAMEQIFAGQRAGILAHIGAPRPFSCVLENTAKF